VVTEVQPAKRRILKTLEEMRELVTAEAKDE